MANTGNQGITAAGRQMPPAMKQFMMNMVGSRIMGDPKLRNILRGVVAGTGFAKDPSKRTGLNLLASMGDPKLRNILRGIVSGAGFAKDPSKGTGLNLLASGLMSSPNARKYLPLLGIMANPSSTGNVVKGLTRQAAVKSLLNKYGPSALYALTNRGGAFGLGTGGPLGQGVLDSFSRNPLGTMGRLKYAAANPLLGLLMAGLNKASPAIEGEKGPLGGTTGPQFANLASKIFPNIKSHEQWISGGGGTGILGGTAGPRTKNFFRNLLGLSPKIEEIEVTAQKRSPTQEIERKIDPWSNLGGMHGQGYVPQGAYGGSSSAFPRGK